MVTCRVQLCWRECAGHIKIAGRARIRFFFIIAVGGLGAITVSNHFIVQEELAGICVLAVWSVWAPSRGGCKYSPFYFALYLPHPRPHVPTICWPSRNHRHLNALRGLWDRWAHLLVGQLVARWRRPARGTWSWRPREEHGPPDPALTARSPPAGPPVHARA